MNASRSDAVSTGAPNVHRLSMGRAESPERVEMVRAVLARHVGMFDFTIGPPDEPYEAEISLRMLPGLKLIRGGTRATTTERRRSFTSDGRDDIIVSVPLRGRMQVRQSGREFDLAPGAAAIASCSEPCALDESRTDGLRIFVPRTALQDLVPGIDDMLARPLAGGSEPLHLLIRYLDLLEGEYSIDPPELGRLAAMHIYDLLALAIGTSRDSGVIAAHRGLRAARLRAIKADIAGRIGAGHIAAEDVAACHGISPRYLRRLFEDEGASFSAFVTEQRLLRARRMLTAPHCAAMPISAVAYDAGFSDLSYFNRVFRRRFGATPSEVRARETG